MSTLFGMMEKGSSAVESAFKLPAESADILQGIILFFVLGTEFFIRYRFAVRRKRKEGGA